MTVQSLKPQLLRALKLREGISIHIGSIIGSGIFIVPAIIAGHLQAMGPIIIVWVLGGALVLFGSLSLAELSSMLPYPGGLYVYLRSSYGRVWAFMYSWNHFFIASAGTVAALSVAFATYLGSFVPALSPQNVIIRYVFTIFGHPREFSVGWIQIVALSVLALTTFINVRGVKFAGWVMNFFTLTKIAVLCVLIFFIVFSGKGSSSNYLPWWPEHWSWNYTSAFGLAMISVLWSYDGWISVTLMAGEISNPRRNVPLSLLFGTLGVIVLYLASNIAFIYIIPIGNMSSSPRIAADAAQIVMGATGAGFIIAGILCSGFGCINGAMMSAPRTIYAAGADGAFSQKFNRIHPKFHTPSNAVISYGIWGGILTLSGTYDQIISYVIFGGWAFYALSVFSVIILRWKMPDEPRAYKTWGYPYTTLLFTCVAGWFLVNTIIHDSRNAVIGIVLLLFSLPFYWFWSRKNKPDSSYLEGLKNEGNLNF